LPCHTLAGTLPCAQGCFLPAASAKSFPPGARQRPAGASRGRRPAPAAPAPTAARPAGDTSRNLAWRLEHGEGPERLRPAAVVILVGTNDLTQPEHPLARPQLGRRAAGGGARRAACSARVGVGAADTPRMHHKHMCLDIL